MTMPLKVRISSPWVREQVRTHGGRLFIVERLSVVG
jgi:hypothetical protein